VTAVYFSSPSGTASLAGSEHQRLWHMIEDITAGLLAVRKPWGQERMKELTGTEAPEGHAPSVSGLLRPASRGDRVRRAFLVGLVGEDGIAAVIPEPS
jgi:hypothetical protein